MKFDVDIRGPKRMNLNDFGDPSLSSSATRRKNLPQVKLYGRFILEILNPIPCPQMIYPWHFNTPSGQTAVAQQCLPAKDTLLWDSG